MRQAEEQEKDHTYPKDGDDGLMDVDPPPSLIISAVDILRVQEPTVVKAKGRPPGALNRVWAGASQRPTASQQRQQTFEDSTRREPSGFEYADTQIPDSQPPPPSPRQRGRRGGHQGAARGRAKGRGQTGGVPASYMGTFQM